LKYHSQPPVIAFSRARIARLKNRSSPRKSAARRFVTQPAARAIPIQSPAARAAAPAVCFDQNPALRSSRAPTVADLDPRRLPGTHARPVKASAQANWSWRASYRNGRLRVCYQPPRDRPDTQGLNGRDCTCLCRGSATAPKRQAGDQPGKAEAGRDGEQQRPPGPEVNALRDGGYHREKRGVEGSGIAGGRILKQRLPEVQCVGISA